MGAFLRAFRDKINKNGQFLGGRLGFRGQHFDLKKIQRLYQTQNLLQIMILLSNMTQFNQMTQHGVEPQK